MMKEKSYIFTIGQEILEGSDVVNKAFNATTKDFLLANGLHLMSGKNVLDLGCGAGTMTRWIAEQVGKNGKVMGIDSDSYQIEVANKKTRSENLFNCEFQALSAYDIDEINHPVDLVYCRFLLHHLNEPDKVIKKVYNILNAGGFFISEEGICDHGFSYPPSDAFKAIPDEGEVPDKNIGKKLYYKLSRAGFSIQKVNIVQPVLVRKEEKEMLLEAHVAGKESFLASGNTEEKWQRLYEETQKIIKNDEQIVGFYASCQIAAVKV